MTQIRECAHCGVSKDWPTAFADPEGLRCHRCPEPPDMMHKVTAYIDPLEPVAEDDRKLSVAARALVEKLREVHDSADYQAVWTMYVARGGRYLGPTYGTELDALEDALRAAAA